MLAIVTAKYKASQEQYTTKVSSSSVDSSKKAKHKVK